MNKVDPMSVVAFPLSERQKGYIQDQFNFSDDPFLTIGGYAELSAGLDVQKLINAFNRLSYSADVFSIRLVNDVVSDTGAVQQILSAAPYCKLEVIDLSTNENCDDELQTIITQSSRHNFSCFEEQNFIFYLFKLPEKYVAFGSGNHIFCDGLSFANILKNLAVFYGAEVGNLECVRLADDILSSTKFLEYLNEEASYLSSERYANSKRYWIDTFGSGWSSPLFIKKYFPEAGSDTSFKVTIPIEGKYKHALTYLSQETGVHEHQTLLSILGIYLSTAYQVDTVSIGLDAHNRLSPSKRSSIGLFVNTFPILLRKIEGKFSDYAKSTKRSFFKGLRHQQFPLNRVRDILIESGNDSNSLFDVWFDYQNFNFDFELHDIVDKLQVLFNGAGQVPLKVAYWAYGDKQASELIFEANLSFLSKNELKQIVDRYLYLLCSLSSDTCISKLSIVSPEEMRKILKFSAGITAPVSGKSLLKELDKHAICIPNKIALIFGDKKITYAELVNKVNKVGAYLISRGARSGIPIGICLPRSEQSLIMMLAILRSGSAFLNMDPKYPVPHLNYILADSNTRLLISDRDVVAKLAISENVKCIFVSEMLIECLPDAPLDTGRYPQSVDLAYLIYTSGSTGSPKGVMIEHGNLNNCLESIKSSPGMSSEDVLLAITTFSFDISILEVLLPIYCGASVVITSDNDSADPKQLESLIIKHQISVLQATPGTWSLLVDIGWSPRRRIKALTGGEAINSGVKDYLVGQNNIDLWNMYGPTETTIWSTISKIYKDVFLGHPILNTRCYVVDNDINLRPIGLPGELCIAGMGVARGYLGRPELTNERFIVNPFDSTPGYNRLYRTGDLVVLSETGEVEYCGRLDDQIKVKGYRIEPSEVAITISKLPWISEVIVIGYLDGLAAYYKLKSSIKINNPDLEIRRYLSSVLPGFMIPKYFLAVDEFPRTDNGKLNKRSLPAPILFNPGVSKKLLLSGQEIIVAELWSEILGVSSEHIGLDSNFFDLGGDSLASVRFVLRAEERGIYVEARRLYLHPTLEEFCSNLRASKSDIQATSLLSVAIETCFTADQIAFLENLSDINAYTIDSILDVNQLNVDVLERSLKLLIQQNESLRLNFVFEEYWKALIEPPSSQPYDCFQYKKLPCSWSEININEYMEGSFSVMRSKLTLEFGPKFYIFLVEDKNFYQRIFFTISHLVCDRYGIEIFFDGLMKNYFSLTHKNDSPSSGLTKINAYHNLVSQHFNAVNGNAYSKQFEYWESLPWGNLRSLHCDRVLQAFNNNMNTSHNFFCELSEEDTMVLQRELPQYFGVSLLELLIAKVCCFFSKLNESESQYIQVFDANREGLSAYNEPSRILFTSAVLRNLFLKKNSKLSEYDYIRDVKRQIDSVPFRGVGLIQLKHLSKCSKTKHHAMSFPTPEIRFNFIGELLERTGLEHIGSVSPLYHQIPKAETKKNISRGVLIQLHWIIQSGKLMMTWEYSTSLHDRSTIENWAMLCKRELELFIRNTLNKKSIDSVLVSLSD